MKLSVVGDSAIKLSVVGDSAIKMACLQVNPGHEFDVVEALESACKAKESVSNYSIVKGFGHYDIILFYEGENFEYHLTDYGPIQGILSYTTFLCFSYLGSVGEKIFKKFNESYFVGIGLIKFNTSIQDVESAENKFFQYCKKESIIVPEFLGTIGWNEIVVLLFNDDIKPIVNSLLRLNYNKEMDGLIEKTYSSIGIKHACLPNCNEKKTVSEIEHKLQGTSNGFGELNDSVPIIKISAKPLYYDEIKNFWKQQCFDTREILGLYDISCVPQKNSNLTWAKVIASLLVFRHKFKGKLKSTYTSLEIIKSSCSDLSSSDLTGNESTENLVTQSEFTDFRFEDLDVFGPANGLLANQFYTLNSLRQYPISGKAFHDMAYYTKAIIQIGKEFSAEKRDCEEPSKLAAVSKTLEDIAMGATYAISRGCQLRSYGIFGNIELPHGGFSRLRGGAQRALAAVQFFPNYILSGLVCNWDGFVIVDEAKFSHINEVISVPSGSFWRPSSWWAILHETGHVFFTKEKWITEEENIIKSILINKSKPELWFEFLLELGAEIFCYEIGFFEDFDLYMTVLLEYLVDIDPTQRKHFDMTVYLNRTFFVEMYSKVFKEKSIDQFTLRDDEKMFNLAITHVEKAVEIIDNRIKETSKNTNEQFSIHNKNFIAASLAMTIRELDHFSEYLNNEINKLRIEIDSHDSGNPIILSKKPYNYYEHDIAPAFKSISDGQIWWGDLPNPIALLYMLVMHRKKLSFSSSIAAVLTFWNQNN